MSEILGIECNLEEYGWYMYFINGNTKRKNTFENLLQEYSLQTTIIKVRQMIINENLDKYNAEDLEKAFTTGKEQFRIALQEMFGEYISSSTLDYILKLIQKNGWTMQKLYEMHVDCPIKKTLRILSGRCL